MKKLFILILIIVFSAAMQGCTGGTSSNNSSGTTLQTTLTQDTTTQSETTLQSSDETSSVETTQADGQQTDVTQQSGSSSENEAIIYKNTEYGFDFTLPASWENYKIIDEKWEGLAVGGDSGEKVVETGPQILIRHPKWTSEKVRQDIPVMVFTIKQWNSLQKDEFHIGAAPIGPSELGRNNKYVFALPARYNFAFPEGFEEVEDILKGNPLHPFDLKN